MRPGATDVTEPSSRPLVRGASESGFSLIELLVAMALSLVVGAAAITFMVFTFNEQNIVTSRTVATTQAAGGLEQLVRDLREAMTSVTISTTGGSTSISFQIPTPTTGSGEAVAWSCPSSTATSVGPCTRALNGGSARTVITGVQSMVLTPVYGGTATTPSNATDIASVGMTLTVRITSYGLASSNGTVTTAATGTANAPIVLQATADLRNFG
jgi:prepilin-type N-terminal cleavage/methylation domain-containing protein